MGKILSVLMVSILLAGCAGGRKSAKANAPSGGDAAGPKKSLAFALPGVPLKNSPELLQDTPAKPAKPAKPAEPPAAKEEPAPETPAEAKASQAAPKGDLEFHMEAAKKYSLKKRYKSAAAEFGAAVPFVPAGDALAVQLLERQGSMLLRSGSEAKAEEAFLAAINKAKELKTAGNDLANAHVGLGYCLEKKKNIPEAIKNYEKAIELTDSKKVKARVAQTILDLKAAKK